MLDLSSDVLFNVLAQLTRIADALEQQRPPQPSPWQDGVLAWLWRPTSASGASAAALLPVEQPDLIQFADLKNVERQRRLIEQNTRQFVAGKPANNVLLTGSRGTGKSSLVKACLAAFHAQGLRLIEVSLSERFGLWISFYAFSKNEYLAAVEHSLCRKAAQRGYVCRIYPVKCKLNYQKAFD